jgi:hypothetical protein
MYESLERLPNLTRDRYGNLNLKGENIGYSGLHARVKHVLALEGSVLAGTVLSELLDWLRWGSETFVRWDCTLPELILVIEKWLEANHDAPLSLFNPYFSQEVDWSQLWIERGMKGDMYVKYRCRCGILHGEFDLECQACWQKWHEMERLNMGPRGEGSYNLVLHGAAGGSVSAAVWTNRNWLFLLPLEFERKNDLYSPTYSPGHSMLDA